MSGIVRQLETIRRLARTLLLAQRVSLIFAVALAAILVGAGLDYVIRFPSGPRVFGLGIAIFILAIVLWRYLVPAFRFRPTLSDIALRIESDPRRADILSGYLTSALEFAQTGQTESSPLAARMAEETQRRLDQSPLRGSLTPRRALLSFASAGLITLAAASFLTVAPETTLIGLQRILLPWTGAAWPSLTHIISDTSSAVHPIGTALPLRARVTLGYDAAMRVEARYRFHEEGVPGPWQSVFLTAQSDTSFERLIEPSGQAVEVTFRTFDDQTEVQLIRLAVQPSIAAVSVSVIPPAYAAATIPAVTADLGDGASPGGRSTDPILEGSEIALTFKFNKPLPVPQSQSESLDLLGLVDPYTAPNISFDWLDGKPDAENPSQSLSTSCRLRWLAKSTTQFMPRLVDQYGLTSPHDAAFSITIVPDEPPAAVMVSPLGDESVLPTAQVEVAAEGHDDVALSQLSLQASHFSPTSASLSPSPSMDGPGATAPLNLVADRSLVSKPTTAPLFKLETSLDLNTFEVHPGDVLEVRALAADSFALNGRSHDPVASIARRLTIISEAQFAESVLKDLAGIRDSAIRASSDQGSLRQLAGTAVAPESLQGAMREQARLGLRIDRIRDALARVDQRIARNGFDDSNLTEKVRRGTSLINQAGAASNLSIDSLLNLTNALADPEAGSAQLEAARTAAQQNQDAVRSQIDDLISLLSVDEDSWVIRRQVEKLLETQSKTAQETRAATDSMRGKTVQELSSAERQRLDDIAAEQDEIARQTDDTVRDMRDAADRLRQSNPSLSDALEEAARQAQQQSLSSRMQEAASDVRENRGQRANQGQQSAQETLKDMLTRLERVERDHAQKLNRQLDSIIASLEVLVAAQRAHLEAVGAPQAAPSALAESLIRINTNSLSVRDQISAAGSELQQVAKLVGEAAEAQSLAIGFLRADRPDLVAATDAERHSFDRLTQALDLARKLQENLQRQESQKKRAELLAAYRAIQRSQLDVADQTGPLDAGRPLDRREQAAARRIADAQDAIRADANTLMADTLGLSDALVFKAGHDLIDELSQTIAQSLRNARADSTVRGGQGEIVDILTAFIDALEEQQDQAEEFERAGEGGGGGSGAGSGGQQDDQLLPPMTQLKALRSMQDALYRATRRLDEAQGLTPESRRAQVDALGRSQTRLADLTRQLIEEVGKQQNQGGMQLPPEHDGSPSESPQEHQR